MQIMVNELSQKIDSLIVEIEKGESCIILKEGTPIAQILPLNKNEKGWKRKIEKIKLPDGLSVCCHERSVPV